MTKQALRWDLSGLSAEERDRFIDEVLDEAGQETALVRDTADIEALQEHLNSDKNPQAAMDEGSQLFEVGDPELILITLESTLILLEYGQISKNVYQIWKDRKETDENIERVPESEAVSNTDGDGSE